MSSPRFAESKIDGQSSLRNITKSIEIKMFVKSITTYLNIGNVFVQFNRYFTL